MARENDNVIYVHSDPDFSIGCDEFQWILYLDLQPNGKYYNTTNYFPSVTMLLDDLAETMFRRYALSQTRNKLFKSLEDLDASVLKVYELITAVTSNWKFKGTSEALIEAWRVKNTKKGTKRALELERAEKRTIL